MKHLSISVFALLVLLFAASCSGGPQQLGPTPTAKSFLSALQNGDYESAKEYCTPDSRDKLNWFKSFSSMGANPFDEPYEVVREELSGDYATVFYTQGDDKEKMVKLRNTTGKWEVIASKNDLNADEEDAEGFADSGNDIGEEFAEGFENSMEELTKGLDELGDGIENGFPASDTDESPGITYKEARAGKSPEDIASAFLTALKYNDYKGATQYASARTADVLDMKSSLSSDGDFGEFTLGKTTLEGDYAKVYYTNEDGEERNVKLGKDSEGNWEVIMTKSDFED